MEDMVESARKHAKPRECRREERKKFLCGFYYRHAFRHSEVSDCVVMTNISLKAWDVLRHWVSYNRLYEQKEQEIRCREELARKNEVLQNKFEKIKKTIATLKKYLRGQS